MIGTRHFLEVIDLDPGELRRVLDLAERAITGLGRPLAGHGVALVFEKPSNRTRHSMEMAVVQLGGHPVYTRGEEIGFDVRETVEDITRILAGYHRVLAARVFDHRVVERMAEVSTAPVVNLLSDRSHPMQTLADLLTMRQHLGPLTGRSIAWVGDFNNVARSLCQGAAMMGAHLRVSSPVGYAPTSAELAQFADLGAASVELDLDPRTVVKGADAIHTDTWTSMGQEAEQQARREVFRPYQVTSELMAAAAPGAIFLHCMPAHRGDEVTAEVFDGPASVVVAQGHNRLHSARGLLAFVLGVR